MAIANNTSTAVPDSISQLLGGVRSSNSMLFERNPSLLKQAHKNLAAISIAVTVTTSGLIQIPLSRPLFPTESNELVKKDFSQNEAKKRFALLKTAHFNSQNKVMRVAKAKQALRAITPFDGIEQKNWNEILEDKDFLS